MKRKFAILASKVRATLDSTDLDPSMRAGVWAECVNTTTLIENILVKEKCEKGAYEKFYGRNHSFVKHLHEFKEVGAVAHADRKIKFKFTNRGRVCLFVGYATNHAADVHRMLALDTKRITISKDIIWLNKSYSEWKHEKNKEECYEEKKSILKNKETVSNEKKNNEDTDMELEEEEEASPKSRLEKQLDIDTHEDIGNVEERAKGEKY